jgi:hypothetical protein
MVRLARTVDLHSWSCLAYCLLDSHLHLIVETPEPNLGIGMKWFKGAYAQEFNYRHDRKGHLLRRPVLLGDHQTRESPCERDPLRDPEPGPSRHRRRSSALAMEQLRRDHRPRPGTAVPRCRQDSGARRRARRCRPSPARLGGDRRQRTRLAVGARGVRPVGSDPRILRTASPGVRPNGSDPSTPSRST